MKIPNPLALIRRQTGEPVPSVDLVDATATRQHLLASPTGTWAWYRLGPTRWFYADTDHRAGVLAAGTTRWAELAGHRVHERITSEGFSWEAWAEQFDARFGPGSLPDPDDGPGRVERLVETQLAIAGTGKHSAEPITYLGVRFTERQLTGEQLRTVLDVAPIKDDRLRAEREKLREVGVSVRREAFTASAVGSVELERLLHTSVALGIPAEPTAVVGDRDDDWNSPPGSAAARSVRLSVEPYGPHVRVDAMRAGTQATAYVSILTVEHVARRRPLAGDSVPWLAYIARSDVPTEVSAVFDVLRGKDLRLAAEQTRKLNENVSRHYADDHGETPPQRVSDGIDDAFRIEGETHSRDKDVATRLAGPIRVATWATVSDQGHDAAEEEVAAHVRELTAACAEDVAVTLVHDARQYPRYLEFVPGNSQDLQDFKQTMPAYFAVTAVPNAANRLGQGEERGFWHGPILGGTGHHIHDPWYGPRHNMSGYHTVTSAPGGGKSVLGGRLLYDSATAGINSVGFAPAGDWVRLADMPELRGHVEIIDLAGAKPGTLPPHSLIPEPRLGDYANAVEHADAVRDANADRRDYAVDALMLQLPAGLVADKPGVVTALEAAVNTAGGSFGTNPWRIIDALNSDGDLAREVASILTNTSTSKGYALIWPQDRNADLAAGRSDSTATLTIITMRDLVTPPDGVDPRHWTRAERSSRPAMYLGARFAMRTLTAMRGPKTIVLDETGISTAGQSAIGPFQLRASRDSRKNEGAVYSLGQNPGDQARIDPEIGNLIGSGWIGRIPDRAVAARALTSLGIPGEYVRVVTDKLGEGRFLRRDWHGNVERTQLQVPPRLLDAIQSTPKEKQASRVVSEVVLAEMRDYGRRARKVAA